MRAGLGVLVHEMLSLRVGAFLLPLLLAPVSVAALVLPCEEANNKDMGSIGFRPSDTGTCLPGAEPQLSGVSDYKMVIDVANWESSQMVSMIMGILLSEHMGYDVIFNYAPLVEEVRRLLVPLPEDMRPTRGIESTPWLWNKNSAERRQVLGSNLACVADATDRFALSNMEVWNIPFGPGTDWIGESFILGDGIGYHGQSGWFVPAFLSMGVASLWSSYRDLRGQPPQAWRDYGFNASDLVNCSNVNLGTCFPESGRGTPHDCRVWCRRASSSGTIPLWAIHPTYDAGYNEEIIYNNELDVSVVYAGREEQERKVMESFNASDGGLPGNICFPVVALMHMRSEPEQTAADGAEAGEPETSSVGAAIIGWLVSQMVYLVLALVFAYLYRAHKEQFLCQMIKDPNEKDYKQWSSPVLEPILFWSCLCPGIRWADTMSMSNLLPGYWKAFLLFFGISVVSGLSLGLPGWILMTCFMTFFRTKLRTRFGMEQSVLADFCCYCWCMPCVIAQEARHVEDAQLAGRLV